MTRTVIIRPQTNDHVSPSDQFSTRFFPSSFLHPSFLSFSFFSSVRSFVSLVSSRGEDKTGARTKIRARVRARSRPPIFGWLPSLPRPILPACFAHKEIPSSIKESARARINEPRFTSPRFAVRCTSPSLPFRFAVTQVTRPSKIKTIFHNLPLGAWLIDFSPSVARGGKFRTNSSIRFRSIASRVSG